MPLGPLECPLRVQTRTHAPQQAAFLFEYLVGELGLLRPVWIILILRQAAVGASNRKDSTVGTARDCCAARFRASDRVASPCKIDAIAQTSCRPLQPR